jgi:Na+-driven multidrug efflux pump
MVGCAYLAAVQLELPLHYVWLCVPIAWSLCLALSYLWVRGGFWSRREL